MSLRIKFFAILVLLSMFICVSNAYAGIWDMPENNSSYGYKIDNLYDMIFWITSVVFVLTELILIYTIFRFRKKKGRKATYSHGNKNLEITWTIATALILIFITIFQSSVWSDLKINYPTDRTNTLQVQVLAKQFEWSFRYAGNDGKFGTKDDVYSRTNELNIPVKYDVEIEMRSIDVIHSLFIPHMRFKQDVVPGITTRGWLHALRTTQEGKDSRSDEQFRYDIACAELCGNLHYNMRGKMIVLEKEDFDAWINRVSQANATANPRSLRTEINLWKGWDNSIKVDEVKLPESHE